MTCQQAEDKLLDFLAEPMSADVGRALEDHIARCATCREFANFRQLLDTRLMAAVSPVSLSPEFRATLREKVQRNRVRDWPESLPDIAHLLGCTLAILLLLWAVPQYSRTILLAGTAFTMITYFVQAVIRSSLERPEPDL